MLITLNQNISIAEKPSEAVESHKSHLKHKLSYSTLG